MYSQDVQLRLLTLRNTARERKLSLEETKEVITLMRGERERGPVATAGSRAKKASAKPTVEQADASLDDFLGA